MNKFFKLIFVLCAICGFTQAQAQPARPKLVVGLVVDQMRWDYLCRYQDRYCEGGFKRLLNEGFSYENCRIPYIPSVTAIGHTSIYTGSVPSIHGIAGNNFMKDGKKTYCTEDNTVKPVGSNGKAGMESPRNMWCTTIGDELRIATNDRSKVIGVAIKDRAAILPAGHHANGAYWFDPEAGKFITSSFYMDKLPAWVNNFNKQNFLRGGYFVHQFGYQSATSSSFKVSMEEPETHSAFGVGGRLVGLMYEHSDDKFMGTGSAYTDAQSFKKQTNQTGYQGTGFLTRLVYHPLIEKGNLFHVGIGLNYELAAENRSNMEFKAPYPVRVAGINAIGAKITDAKSDFKFSGELMAAKGHVGIEGKYIFMNVDRKGDAKSYNAWGAYGNLRFLLNNEYEYVKNDAGIATPAPKSWELVAAYNYTDMNDAKAGFHGGKLSDWALTMNYYINKYMIWRVSGHIVRAGESDYSGFNKNTFRVIETRLQFKF